MWNILLRANNRLCPVKTYQANRKESPPIQKQRPPCLKLLLSYLPQTYVRPKKKKSSRAVCVTTASKSCLPVMHGSTMASNFWPVRCTMMTRRARAGFLTLWDQDKCTSYKYTYKQTCASWDTYTKTYTSQHCKHTHQSVSLHSVLRILMKKKGVDGKQTV